MNKGLTKNAALTTALAFHYQFLIGINQCFSLESDQSIFFERDGDVSVSGEKTENSVQIEVKNYADTLGDHHENFWKTLKNWLDLKFEHEKYGALVLHTTQPFGATTRFKDWNTLDAQQRFNVLQEIYSERTKDELEAKEPKAIVTFQKKVMETDFNKLIQVIAKVNLYIEADDHEAINRTILERPIGIPKYNRERYLEGLIGFVYSLANKKSWEVKKKDFDAKCEELTATYRKTDFTFPQFIGYEATDTEIDMHQTKLFVQKIHDIEHHSFIDEAISNYIELQNSLTEQLHEHPLYAAKTKDYQKRIIKILKINYSTAQLEAVDWLKSSKLFYNKTMVENSLPIDGHLPPIEYKNGLIHDAMDDEKQVLKWKVEP
ncbi:hypothetical protein KTI96_01345 [Acinetobacter bereziniae]|uniref:hypothetical protein n=1 Tax=Acinetobacter bereziniae TaxID=106648 RepID=UPI0021CD4A39|nr:hypothetical protein [Acinetobacter bereziniae]MCU4535807.1 hypothetical protein [Acinetobacter bereziniae]